MNIARNAELCTGCMLCYNICSAGAIKLVPDDKGFIYPQMQLDKCIGCGTCSRCCPVNDENVESNKVSNSSDALFKQEVKAAWSKNRNNRIKSSSGGLFITLAEVVLKKNGVVCASRFSEDFHSVEFDICDSMDDIGPFLGSKYIQSSPNLIYRQVKQILKDGRYALFVGTGCQVAALKKFVGTSSDKLICIDLVCHGVPSPKVWSDYLSHLKHKHDARGVDSVSFRIKNPSWKEYSMEVCFSNGKAYRKVKTQDPYMIAFAKDIMLRPSCAKCQYACLNREGDITLCDFWAYRSFEFKTRNIEKGISCCIVNSSKGKALFDEISDKIISVDGDMKEAISGNKSLIKPWANNEKTDEFWMAYSKNGIAALIDFCKPYRNPMKMKINWFLLDHLWMLPKPILKKFIRRRKG